MTDQIIKTEDSELLDLSHPPRSRLLARHPRQGVIGDHKEPGPRYAKDFLSSHKGNSVPFERHGGGHKAGENKAPFLFGIKPVPNGVKFIDVLGMAIMK